MAEKIADWYVLFTALGELRPVFGHGGIEIQKALVGETVGADGSHTLGGGVEVDDSIAMPEAGAVGVGVTGPEIDHHLAFDHDGYSGADLAVVGEVGEEGFLHGLESTVTDALHFGSACHRNPPPAGNMVALSYTDGRLYATGFRSCFDTSA